MNHNHKFVMSTIYEIVTFEETKQNEISKLREITKC